jgi:hypothetical protein
MASCLHVRAAWPSLDLIAGKIELVATQNSASAFFGALQYIS